MQFQLAMAPLTHRVSCSYLFWSNHTRVGKVANDHNQSLPQESSLRTNPLIMSSGFLFSKENRNQKRKNRDYS